ncbi:UNVERIFIED_CONTAM: hypothetical protein K2H54_018396 [Gekko kuhli]
MHTTLPPFIRATQRFYQAAQNGSGVGNPPPRNSRMTDTQPQRGSPPPTSLQGHVGKQEPPGEFQAVGQLLEVQQVLLGNAGKGETSPKGDCGSRKPTCQMRSASA